MMLGLAKEVERRIEYVGITGKKITLKVMQRKEGASEPAKIFRHGSCRHLSKSCDSPMSTAPTRDSSILSDVKMKLFAGLGVSKDEVQGMGITMSKVSTETENAMPGATKHMLSTPNVIKSAHLLLEKIGGGGWFYFTKTKISKALQMLLQVNNHVVRINRM
eukprot:13681681-Ditylum_brightwellii.AAC.1